MLWDLLQQYQIGDQREQQMSIQECVDALRKELLVTRRMVTKLSEILVDQLGVDPASLRLDLSDIEDLMDE